MCITAISAIGMLASAAACDPPAQPGDYRARGDDPAWSLTMDERRIRFAPAGERVLSVPRPAPVRGFNGEYYRAQGLIVRIAHVECRDARSGGTFRDTVTVTRGGNRTVRGCGGAPLDPAAEAPSLLEGSWRVEAIAGRPPLPGSAPMISFAGARLTGTTGCNRFSGGFRFARGRLRAEMPATTRRGCPGGLDLQEIRMLELLNQPLSVSRNRAGKLVMTAAGGDTLVLAPMRDAARD